VPHLFGYYTTNGYSANGDNIGGYNRDVDGWIQYSSSIYPGAVSSPNSVRGGAQYVMFIKYQLYQGNWWLNCNNNWIGYYPASLFNKEGLNSQAGKIAFYGEIVDSSDHSGLTNTDMGSGYWPEYRWPWAAYMRNLWYQSDTNGAMSQYNASTVFASDPDLYDIENHMNSGTTWDSYFWLGGPGVG
jgi:neprosin-like protein